MELAVRWQNMSVNSDSTTRHDYLEARWRRSEGRGHEDTGRFYFIM